MVRRPVIGLPLLKNLLANCLLLLLLGLVALCHPDPARALEIAILKSADIAPYNRAVAGFKGATTARTTFIEYDLRGNLELGRKLARKIRASNAALVLAVGLKAALVAKLEVFDIPIVFCLVLDPVKYHLTAPNMTGVLAETPSNRQFSALRAVLPIAKRIGVLYDPEKTGRHVEKARQEAKALGLELVARRVGAEKEVPTTLRAIIPSIEALWLLPDSTVLNEDSLKFILNTALDSSLPVIGYSPHIVRYGALFGLFVRYQDMGHQAGVLARKILDGQIAVPHAPILPERVSMALNLKVANFLGITIPPHVVKSASELY